MNVLKLKCGMQFNDNEKRQQWLPLGDLSIFQSGKKWLFPII